jgi:putative hydroxymethylpyrimidine transport system substrate-binding protein
MRRPLALAALLLTIAAATGCGAKEEPTDGAGGGTREDLRLVLDYFPNADHAGIYAAQASGEYGRAGGTRARSSSPSGRSCRSR